MTTINNLSTIDSVSSGDQVPVYDESAGTARKMSVSQLMAFFSANFASPEFEVTISSPIAGFNQVLAASSKSVWLLLTPAGTLATGTVTLPPVADCFDGQEVLVTSTEAITTLIVAGNGATVSGAPAALAADGFFKLRYNLLLTTWYCVAQSLGSAQTVFNNITANTVTMPSGGAIVGQTSGENVLGFTDTAGAVNNLRVANKATGSAPTLIAVGDDTDIGIDIQPKNAGVVTINSDEIVTLAATQTLTNKTLTAPVCDAIKTGGAGASTVGLLNVIYPPATSQGFRTVIVDSNTGLAAGLGNVVAGGGSTVVPVYCDGTNWRIG